MKEILVDWSTSNGGGKVSVFYGLDGTSAAAQRAALNTWLQAIDNYLYTSTVWTIRNSGRSLNINTGALEGIWTDATAYTGVGAVSAGAASPDAVQVLCQWHTGTIINGRYLRGRTFIPGLANGQVANGNLASGAQTAMATASNALATSGNQIAIWHRPTNGVGGQAFAIQSATVWGELAVLRRRRG